MITVLVLICLTSTARTDCDEKSAQQVMYIQNVPEGSCGPAAEGFLSGGPYTAVEDNKDVYAKILCRPRP